ncbi:MAG TPA: DUF4954 family protein, partial [Sediminibacterium sp.]|nr:DUF4954 family protein [Sediminibacterium sp.]
MKNLTINSGPEGKTQIGEGCELVNGIVGYGCRIFYGVKAVRFIMAAHSQLKYGARLINSYLGNNATISCCEVLNSLIFPAHEQHHNNSFLCAALVMGQSNIAAGATIGSNHNSRGADGEIIMGRGFWPGLCVSLKHNSRFASFIILSKGDYPAELDIPFPFALISNDLHKNQLVIMPAYWFLYNLYALARNAWKYIDRDKRIERIQHLEYDFLAPDTINEMFHSLVLLETATGKAWQAANPEKQSKKTAQELGRELLLHQPEEAARLEILADRVENSNRKALLLKVPQAHAIYRELIVYYGITQMIQWISHTKPANFEALQQTLPFRPKRITDWMNVGGQLMTATEVSALRDKIKNGRINTWEDVHTYYQKAGEKYPAAKLEHALASLTEITGINPKKMDVAALDKLLLQSLKTKEWLTEGILQTRAKDYRNPFRRMVYESDEEMNKVMGRLEDNSFIREQEQELTAFRKQIAAFRRRYCAGSTKK